MLLPIYQVTFKKVRNKHVAKLVENIAHVKYTFFYTDE